IIRTRVSYLTLESPDSARDTVDLDTDAAAATSLIVGRNGLPPYLNRQRWCTTLPLCGARAWPVCRCRAPVPLSARCRPPVRRRRGRPSQRSCRRPERPRRTSIIAAVPVRRLKRVHHGPMGHCNRLHLHSSPNFAPVLPENFPFLSLGAGSGPSSGAPLAAPPDTCLPRRGKPRHGPASARRLPLKPHSCG